MPLYAVDPTDTLIQASTFQARFEPCPGNGVFPETFGPGDAKEICLVYLVPDGGELTAVSFRPNQDFDPITWTGPIKKPPRRQGLSAALFGRSPASAPDNGAMSACPRR